MRRLWIPLALVAATASLNISIQGSSGSRGGGVPGKTGAAVGHSKPLPAFIQKREKERLAAADLVARGLAKADANGIVTLRNGRFVQHRLQGVENLTTVLIDFSDVTHGAIPQPNRQTDNNTYWSADVSPAHYQDMLFTPGGGSYGRPSMRDFYLEQSSGTFTWTGQVSDWVRISATAENLGANLRSTGAGGDDANGPVYRVVDYALQALAGSPNYGNIDLAQVDRVDRYDCDADGNFAEPDGYIDHFGLVHAGEGEEAGGGAQGGDAIWSHRWYANLNFDSGPALCKMGGYNLPGTDLWVGDYTIMPENGGVGVFAHEFGHDLGLPDLYDRFGPDNGTGYWTLMSSGSWASSSPDVIGDRPVHMGAWEKLALGWLDNTLARVALGSDVTVDLGPAEGATRGNYQALRVDLPDITRSVTAFAVDGSDPNYFYSGQGDNLDQTMTTSRSLSVATPISFRANWDIELDWDYAYLDALVGGSWRHIQTSASSTTSPNGQNFGFGITGVSSGWTTVTATLPAGTTAYRFRYWTDGSLVRPGIGIDTISVGGLVDNSTNTAAWTLSGFRQTTGGAYTDTFFRYYLAESRSYIRADASLCGAYNFVRGNIVEKQCYADGLLVWYRNSQVPDNDTSRHPGSGQILPIDAHPATMLRPDGRTAWSGRWQTWDATFGVDTNSISLSQVIGSRTLKSTYTASPVSSFFDSSETAYYNSAVPLNSVRTVGSGLRMDIVGVSADRGSYRVRVYR